MKDRKSIFTLSLDFELFWGVRDNHRAQLYHRNIMGARHAIPAILDLFSQYQIRATWAAVGLLFFDNKVDLLNSLPSIKPRYTNENLSPYTTIQSIGDSEDKDPYHYGLSLIKKIKNTPGQEVATHTFSHYYCLEPGHTVAAFQADLSAAIAAAKLNNIEIKSLVFPRNQFNPECLAICEKYGITSYRGNENCILYAARNKGSESKLRRFARLVDTYFNLSGHHSFKLDDHHENILNVKASRFLRPYSKKLRYLEPLKLKRIKKSMSYTTKSNGIYHLWWHPHNFGVYTKENLNLLESILEHYNNLSQDYNMQCLTMSEIADRFQQGMS